MADRPNAGWDKKLPATHPQWQALDLAHLLSLPAALIPIGQSNSILAEFGAQAGERLWERGRLPGGSIPNTVRLVEAARKADMKVIWTRYEIFRQHYPATPMDKAQYDYWLGDKTWSEDRVQRDWQPIDEIKALVRPEDVEIFYTSLGNLFLGTMLPAYLNMWGIRTVVLCGYHLDWCIEQAARTCRDMGYMPIVVGDACGCGREEDEAPTLERIDRFFAPVVSTDRMVALMRQGAERRLGSHDAVGAQRTAAE